MKKYKLINLETNESTLCDKVVVDSFEYYVSDGEITSFYYNFSTNKIHFENHSKRLEIINNHNRKKVIATNNSDLDLPQIVDEFEKISKRLFPLPEKIKARGSYQKIKNQPYKGFKKWTKSFKVGYIEAKRKYAFTENDMIDFIEWCVINSNPIFPNKNNWELKSDYTKQYSTKQLLELWKSQQPEIIYFKEKQN